jgi:hypothetical protein
VRQKTWVLQQNVKIYLLAFSILACAWQLQKKSYGRLSGNNRPITDYLKNGRLIGFADYHLCKNTNQYIVHNIQSLIRPDCVAQLVECRSTNSKVTVSKPSRGRQSFLLACCLEIMIFLTPEHFLLIILPSEQ